MAGRALLQASGTLSTTAVLLIIAGALLGAVSLVFTARVYSLRQRELAMGTLHTGKPLDDPEFGPLGLATPPREWARSAARLRVEALRQEAAAAEAVKVDSPADAPFFYPHVLEGGRWKQDVRTLKPAAKLPAEVVKTPPLMSMPLPYAAPGGGHYAAPAAGGHYAAPARGQYASAQAVYPNSLLLSPPRVAPPRAHSSAQRLW